MSALVFAAIMASGLGFAFRLGRIAGLRFYDVRGLRPWWRL